jgi:hypothetical protein
MITRNTLRAIAVAASCLAPMAALAQAPAIVIGGTPITGEVGLGVMGVMGQNPDLAGRYTGLNTTGIDLLGDFDFTGRDPWYSGGVRYYELNGDNLVFQTGNRLGDGNGIGTPVNQNSFGSGFSNGIVNAGSLGFRAGDQGIWGVNAYYNSITYTGNVIGSIYTVNGNQASLNPGLVPFGGATHGAAGPITSYTIPSLTATGAILPVQVGTRRDIVGGNFKYIMGDWTFTGAFRHEHKEGSMEEAFDGNWGGMAFAMPIDYDTDRYDATAAYTSRLFQGSLQYTFSHFSDNNLFVTLPYPVSGTGNPATTIFQRAAAYETPPSNSAQYVTLMLATNAVPLTRINLNARVGVEKQDSTFPPNTADPGLSNSFPAAVGLNSNLQGTTANSPDITATVYQVKVSASSNPFANFDTRVYYGIDGRNVSLNQYAVHGSGSGSDATPGSATPYAFVVPQDWLKQNAGAEAGYRIIPEYDTKLTLAYRFDDTDRSNAQVGHSWTNTASIALSSSLGPQADGRLSFDYSNRSGNLSYLTPWLNLDGPTAQVFSGAYYQAPMTSEAVTLRANYTPNETLFGGFYVQFKNENYTYPGIPLGVGTPPSTLATIPLNGVGGGLKQDYALSLGPDITYRPSPDLNLHFFYTYERLFYNFLGNGACSTPADIAANAGLPTACTGSAGFDTNKQTSGTHTIGMSGEWKVNDKLKLKGDYTVSYGSVAFTEFNGVFVTTVPTASLQSYQNVSNYPDINSLMNSLRLTATYEATPSIDLVGMVAYTSFHNTDWNDSPGPIVGTSTAAPNSIGFLTPGYGAPNWSVVMIMGGVKFRFGEPPPPLPSVPAAAPAPAAQPARSYLVFFDWDKATLTDRARQIVKEAADNSAHVQYTRIEVNGYTDTSGTPQYNQGLSIRRADAVKAELVKDGVPVGAISTKGFGETHLLVPTGTGVREPQNRRVEIVIL